MCYQPRAAGEQYLYSSNSNPDNTSLPPAATGEIYKMELDGTVIGKFGKPGEGDRRVRDRPRDRLPQPRRSIVVEITAGARRRSC